MRLRQLRELLAGDASGAALLNCSADVVDAATRLYSACATTHELATARAHEEWARTDAAAARAAAREANECMYAQARTARDDAAAAAKACAAADKARAALDKALSDASKDAAAARAAVAAAQAAQRAEAVRADAAEAALAALRVQLLAHSGGAGAAAADEEDVTLTATLSCDDVEARKRAAAEAAHEVIVVD